MEGNDNAELKAWLQVQGDCTRRTLDRIAARDALFKRLREVGLGTSSAYDMQLAGGRAFFLAVDVGAQLPKLVVRELDGRQRVLVDPETLGRAGRHASVNAFSASPDGKLVAYDLALGGGEVSSIRVLNVATGNDLPDVIDRVWGEIAASWAPDGKSFFYTQMAPAAPDADPMQNMQARVHVLGQPVTKDVALLGNGAPSSLRVTPEEFPHLAIPAGTRWVVASLHGAHHEVRVAVAPVEKLDGTGIGKTPWRPVAEYADRVEDVEIHADRLFLRTFKGANNRKILSVPASDPDLSHARVEVAESPDATIESIARARDGLYFMTMVNGRARLWRMAWSGPPAPVTLPFDGWIDELATDPLRNGARFDLKGWTQPTSYYDFDPDKGAATAAGIAAKTNADFSNIAVDEVDATSSDGTPVPLSILHPRDLPLDGTHPALLNGYGSYGNSMTPSFSTSRLPWLEHGGTYAICHVRGGGEKGYRWQEDGTHEHKMNGIRDFEACAQYLIDHKLTSAGHLAARGVSMGGILVGRTITDRPDLFAAANIGVGVVNPTRILFAENGANQKMELGDPQTEAGFKAIFEIDPYQHVAPSTAYPAVIFTVGLNDRRVAPWMTAKMAARMQAASSGGKPVLVRIDADAGHGFGSTRDQVYAELADVYSFMLRASGDPAFQP